MTFGPRIVEVAVPGRRAVRVDRLLLGRALRVDDQLERPIVDDDLLSRAPSLLGMLGGDQRDRLAEEAHPVDREHGLVGELEPVAFLARHVLVREHRVDAGHAERGGDVDPGDQRVRVRAADRVAPEHVRVHEVARIGELARRLRDPVDARDALADAAELELARCRRAHAPAASLTASRIFW